METYGDLEYDDDDEYKYKILYFLPKYFPLNMKYLKKSGNIDASNATEINLPQLQTSGDISANEAIELKNIIGAIYRNKISNNN
jgi:hypothetical protein